MGAPKSWGPGFVKPLEPSIATPLPTTKWGWEWGGVYSGPAQWVSSHCQSNIVVSTVLLYISLRCCAAVERYLFIHLLWEPPGSDRWAYRRSGQRWWTSTCITFRLDLSPNLLLGERCKTTDCDASTLCVITFLLEITPNGCEIIILCNCEHQHVSK